MRTDNFQLIELSIEEQRQLQRELAAIPGIGNDVLELATTMRFRKASESFDDFLANVKMLAAKSIR